MLMVGCGSKKEAKQELMLALLTEKANLPTDLGNGIVWTDVYLSGNDVVYEYNCNEYVNSIADLNMRSIAVKENILTMLHSSAPQMKEFIDNCKKADVGLIYRYTGNISGDICTIRISPSEL